MLPKRLCTLFFGLSCAAAFTLALNAATLLPGGVGRLSIFAVAPSVDEQYYAALIADGARGHWNLGHASLKEHRGGSATSTYAPLLESAIMRLTGLGIVPTLVIGDLLFPFLIALLLFLGIARGTGSELLAGSATLFLMADTNVGWLRAVTPQATFVAVAAYLAVFLGMKPSRKQYVLRGFLVGLMLYTHIVHATFFLIVEGCDVLRHVVRRTVNRRTLAAHVACFAISFLALLLGKIWLTLLASDPIARADTLRRLGMIESHLPAAPLLQIALIGGIALLWTARRRSPLLKGKAATTILTLLTAGIIGLNQSLFHGIDVIFGLYYEPILRMVLLLAFTIVLWYSVGRRMQHIVAWAAMATALAATSVQALTQKHRSVSLDPPSATDLLAVASWFQKQPPDQVILAPYEIGNILPILTPQYVVFNKVALYQVVRDEELAQRYVLQQTLFPTTIEERGEGYNSVFGLAAGNSTARRRSLCRLHRFFLGGADPCLFSVRSGVHDQTLLMFLDRALTQPQLSRADLTMLLRMFQVDWIVAAGRIPDALGGQCREEQRIGHYTVYRCPS